MRAETLKNKEDKFGFFLIMIVCSFVGGYQCFGGPCCLLAEGIVHQNIHLRGNSLFIRSAGRIDQGKYWRLNNVISSKTVERWPSLFWRQQGRTEDWSSQLWNFIVAPCIWKIHWLLHTNDCTYYVLYISLKFITSKHLKCRYMFRSSDHPQTAHIVPC
jgi:hypothetical protein